MAKATAQYKEVVRPIEKVTLEMNQSEATTLIAILARVGGCPTNSPRKHADAIYKTLVEALNMDYCTLKETNEAQSLYASETRGFRNNIIFEDYTR